MSQNLSSTAVVIGTLRVKNIDFVECDVKMKTLRNAMLEVKTKQPATLKERDFVDCNFDIGYFAKWNILNAYKAECDFNRCTSQNAIIDFAECNV